MSDGHPYAWTCRTCHEPVRHRFVRCVYCDTPFAGVRMRWLGAIIVALMSLAFLTLRGWLTE